MNGGAALRLVDGVFKGGGAKGIVYAAALDALEQRSIWFRSVAGSSAGALTAALIAAGYRPQELRKNAPGAMGAIRGNLFHWVDPFRGYGSLFRTQRLERWLESELRYKLRGDSGGDQNVTFKELNDRDDAIELHVVAMDLARRQPIVFNHHTAPECSVTAAVLASCAIPVAMPAWRVELEDEHGHSHVHRLVDGGAWANYPSFVFRDPSFVRRATNKDSSWQPDTLGFVIQTAGTSDAELKAKRFLGTTRSTEDRGTGREAGVLGALFDWTVLRQLLFGVGPVVLVVALLRIVLGQAETFFPVLDWLPVDLQFVGVTVFVVAAWVAIVFGCAAVLVNVRLASELTDVGLPSLVAALSVGPGVPAWVGAHPEDRVVRLTSPEDLGVKTTSFHVRNEVQQRVAERAFSEADEQLAQLYLNQPSSSQGLSPVELPKPGLLGWYRQNKRFAVWLTLVGLILSGGIVDAFVDFTLGTWSLPIFIVYLFPFFTRHRSEPKPDNGAPKSSGAARTGRLLYFFAVVVGFGLSMRIVGHVIRAAIHPNPDWWAVFYAISGASLLLTVIIVHGARLRSRRLGHKTPNLLAALGMCAVAALIVWRTDVSPFRVPLADFRNAQQYALPILDRAGTRIDYLGTQPLPSEVKSSLRGGDFLRPCPGREDCIVVEHDAKGPPIGSNVDVVVLPRVGHVYFADQLWAGPSAAKRAIVSSMLFGAVLLAAWGVVDLWRVLRSYAMRLRPPRPT